MHDILYTKDINTGVCVCMFRLCALGFHSCVCVCCPALSVYRSRSLCD